MLLVTEAEDAFLGAGFLLVAARTADGRIDAPLVARLLPRLGLHHVGVYRGTVADGAAALGPAMGVGGGPQLHACFLRPAAADRDHLPDLPPAVPVPQRARWPRRDERLAHPVTQAWAVLPTRR